jgi:hypothetical protein
LGRQAVSYEEAESARAQSRAHTESLFRFSPALLVVLALFVDLWRRSDPDLWGHIRFGQILLSTGHITVHNPYTYSAPNHLWLHHEWLSEVMLAWLYNHLGAIGIKLLKLACAGGILTFLALAAAETGAPVTIQTLVLLAVALLMGPTMQYRPQMFDFLFLSAILAMLTRDHTRGRAPLWLAIPIIALWANLHGGFFLGIVALGIYSVIVGAEELRSQGKVERAIRLAAITVLAALSTAITFAIPYARQTWYALWHSVTNPMTHDVIADWRPLISAFVGAFHQLSPASYLGFAVLFFAAAIAVIAVWPRAGYLPLDVIGLVMTAGAFMAVRNIPVGAIAIGPPLMRHLAVATGTVTSGSAQPRESRGAKMRPNWIFELVLGAFAVIFAAMTGLFSNRMWVSPPDPEGAVAFMNEHDLHGNILNNFGWGFYLIWHVTPASKVFIDGRYDLAYPPAVINDFVTFIRDRPGALTMLAKYPSDFVLIKPDDPPVKAMKRARDWTMIYRDSDCILYARKGSAAASIPGVPVTGHAPDPEYFP